jgi:serine/threonine protein kinase
LNDNTGEESLSPVIVIVEQNEKDLKTVTTNVGDVQYDRSNVVGTGGYGVVYAGTFKGEKVAVKRIDIMRTSDNRELENNKILLNHPNIVQFKHYEEDGDFR